MSDVNDFDVAKSINDLLRNLTQDRQRLILRWVAESLHIPLQDRTVRPTAEGTSSLPAGGVHAPPPTLEGSSTVDIKGFVAEKRPGSDIYFAAVVAYYYKFEAAEADRRDSISAEVLQDATRLAGRGRFTKPLATLNNAKKQGYLDAAGRGSFRINSVGENLVAMALPSSSDATAPAKLRVGKSKAKRRVSPVKAKGGRRARG